MTPLPDAHVAPTEESGRLGLYISEAQLILAEKRTAMAGVRTGAALLALPMSVLGLLAATSRYYTFVDNILLLGPLLLVCLILLCVGLWLVVRSVSKLRRHERLLAALKRKSSTLSHMID